MALVDRLTGCILILGGIAQLHGSDRNSVLSSRHLLILLAALAVFSFLLLNVPVVQALPGTFLLVRWIVGVLKEYEKDGRTVGEGLVWVVGATVAAVVLYASLSSVDRKSSAPEADLDAELMDR
jgi:uncharacterized membrane protein HdeD (DUF308 family)